MTKLLKGALPLARGGNVSQNVFNQSMRVLELSLDTFDPDKTPKFNDSYRDDLQFQSGDIIWNTSVNILQVYDGSNWINLSEELPYTTDKLEATGEVGAVQVIASGDIVVTVHG